MEDETPIRLVALGYQGFGNLGDEAILTGIECLLEGTPVTVSTVVTGPRPDEVVGYPLATRIPSPRLLPGLQSLRALRHADGLLLAGGGLIHDHWASVLPRYLAWILAARLLGRRVAWLGVGVGPLRRRPWRWMARTAARLSRVVVVRDAASAALLRGAGRPIVAPDMALFNAPPTDRSRRARDVGVIIRDPGPRGATWRSTLVDALAECSMLLADAGRPPVLMTMAGSADISITREIQAAVVARGGTAPPHEELGPSPDRALTRLAELDGLVSVRLHGLLLGLLAGTACAGIAYDDKVSALAAELGIRDVIVAPADLTGARLVERLRQASDERVRLQVMDRVARIRAQRATLARRFVAALAQGPRTHA